MYRTSLPPVPTGAHYHRPHASKPCRQAWAVPSVALLHVVAVTLAGGHGLLGSSQNRGFTTQFRTLPAHAPERLQLAQWYSRQWGQHMGLSLEQELQRLNQKPDSDGFPHLIAAFEGDRVVGAVQLKRREMASFPQYEHWLGSVFVADTRRGRGLACWLAGGLALSGGLWSALD